MSGEIGTFAALAVLMIGLFTWLRQDIRKVDAKLDVLRGELDAMRGDLGALRERMAHLEGLLDGLREAITGRVGAGS